MSHPARTASEILARCLRLFGPTGAHWGKGELYQHGRYCLIGALSQAAFGEVGYSMRGNPDYATAVRYLQRSTRLKNLVKFNDRASFTEVQKAIRDALKMIRARAGMGGS